MRVGHPQAYITKNRIILLIRFFFAWSLGILANVKLGYVIINLCLNKIRLDPIACRIPPLLQLTV